MSVPEMRTQISISGISFHTLGPVSSTFGLVLVHGWGCQKSDYDPLLEYLSANQRPLDFQILVPDLPGHGSTSADVCPTPSITGFAELFIALMKEVRLKEAVMVGHSMGVRIGSEMWRLNHASDPTPHRLDIRALVFIDGSDYRTRPTIAFDKGDPRAKDMTPEDVAALKAKVFQAMFSPRTPEAFKSSTIAHVASRDKGYSETLRDSMIAYDREMMAETIRDLGREGKTQLLNLQSSDTGGPTGERRPMRTGEVSKWMEWLGEAVPRSRQVVIDQSAHFPHVDRPQLVGEEVWRAVKEAREAKSAE